MSNIDGALDVLLVWNISLVVWPTIFTIINGVTAMACVVNVDLGTKIAQILLCTSIKQPINKISYLFFEFGEVT